MRPVVLSRNPYCSLMMESSRCARMPSACFIFWALTFRSCGVRGLVYRYIPRYSLRVIFIVFGLRMAG